MKLLSQAVEAASKMRMLLLFVALLYVGSYLAGWYLISIKSPIAVETAQAVQAGVVTESPFTAIVQSLQGGDLLKAVLITFLLNLTTGAFLTTTLPGIVPLIGAFGTIAVTVYRGFSIGVIYPDMLASSAAGFALGLGTLLLEWGAYVFSGAAGIHIALAPIMPTRYGVQSRRSAFKTAWKDTVRVYVIVIILLALGAVWEMTGILQAIKPT